MSRTAKPLHVKAAHGSTRMPKEPAPVTVLREIPKPPSHLRGESREIWKATCQALIEMNCLTLQSLTNVECHVNSVTLMRAAMSDKKLKITSKAAAVSEARKSASDLGLSLSAHSKVKVPTAKMKEADLESLVS